MLPPKLAVLKRQLEIELHLDNDDQKTLRILQIVDTDTQFQKKIKASDFISKSFSVAPEFCSFCGKKI
jgi:hypothetical protein